MNENCKKCRSPNIEVIDVIDIVDEDQDFIYELVSVHCTDCDAEYEDERTRSKKYWCKI